MLLGGLQGLSASYGKGGQNSIAKDTASKESTVSAGRTVSIESGGLGFTIGTEKRKDQYSDADLLQKGSTVGSISGNVTITSDKDIHVNASDIIAGKDISMTGENVNISSKDNIYHSEEKHEYKKSGLSVSVGGAGIEAIESVAAPATRMTEVSDHRLKALYGYETAEKIKKNGDALKAAAKGNFSPTVSIGITSSSSKSESHSTMTEAQGSSLQAGQDVTVKTKKDLNVKGSDIVGNHIHLEADNDIHILATEEKETQKSSQSSKGGSLGVSLSAGSVVSVDGKGKENGSTTSYRASTVNANDTLTMKSGKDTDLIGSTVSGNKVKADVYGNLNIESLQTKKEYSEENISAGMSFSTAAGKTSYGGSASKGNMKSHYESVISQAGIRAGGEGFDISVKENTDLKGGVIDSAASKDKNTLTTGTLSWEEKENKADYKAGGMGVSYSPNDKSSKLNQRGLTPNLTPTVKDNADSTTKSAVAEGTIHITNKEKQKQDIASLNRDTKNSLNQLQEIFDKTKVEERQELVGMLEKYGNQAIHTYAESKGWKDGSTEKMLLHGAFGALMGDMAGGSAATGALSGSVNEYVMGYLTKLKGEDWVQKHPDTVQWIGAGVGAAIGTLSKDVLSSINVSLDASKWNYIGEGHENTKPKIVGIGVETEGLGHVALTINFEDGTWAEGDYGRYGGNDTPSSGLRQTPIGRGTYITDNNYNPFESDRMVYMLDPLIVSAPRVTDAYNNQFLNNDYTRSFGNIGITEDRRGNFAHYRKGEGALDYNLFFNNCVTTTIDAINKGKSDWQGRAELTLMLLRNAISPTEVDNILRADYEQFGGKGLVVDVKRGNKVKK